MKFFESNFSSFFPANVAPPTSTSPTSDAAAPTNASSTDQKQRSLAPVDQGSLPIRGAHAVAGGGVPLQAAKGAKSSKEKPKEVEKKREMALFLQKVFPPNNNPKSDKEKAENLVASDKRTKILDLIGLKSVPSKEKKGTLKEAPAARGGLE